MERPLAARSKWRDERDVPACGTHRLVQLAHLPAPEGFDRLFVCAVPRVCLTARPAAAAPQNETASRSSLQVPALLTPQFAAHATSDHPSD